MSHGAREDSKDARVKEGRGGREGGESSKEHGKGTWKVERQWRIAITINLHASGHSTCLYRPFILTMPGAYFRLYISWTPIRDSQLPSFNPHPTSFPSLLSPSHLSLAHTTLENSTKKVPLPPPRISPFRSWADNLGINVYKIWTNLNHRSSPRW